MRRAWLIVPTILAAPAAADSLVGHTVPPYPAGLSSLIGGCVGDTGAGEDICAWSIATLNRESGQAIGVYAARSGGHDADGMPRWIVTSELALPSTEGGYDVVVGECRRNENPDATIVAVARHDPDEEISRDVAWAAQLDRGTGKLSPIDTVSIDCAFPGS